MTATAFADQTVQLWTWSELGFRTVVETPNSHGLFQPPDKNVKPLRMTFTSDGKQLLIEASTLSSPQMILYLLDLQSGSVRRIQLPTTRDQFALPVCAPLKHSRQIMAVSLERRVTLNDYRNLDLNSTVAEPICFHGETCNGMVFSDDGNELLTLSGQRWNLLETIQTWDVSLKIGADFDLNKLPREEVAPQWLHDLTVAITGAPGDSELEDRDFLTIELVQAKFQSESKNGSYVALWQHFFPPKK